MLVEQKRAWFTVVVFFVCLATFIVLMIYTPFPVAFAAFAIFGITGLVNVFFRKKPGQIEYDERDRAIQKNAQLVGMGASYGMFILACMAIWGYLRAVGVEKVSVEVLPMVVFIGGITAFTARAIALLILYWEERA